MFIITTIILLSLILIIALVCCVVVYFKFIRNSKDTSKLWKFIELALSIVAIGIFIPLVISIGDYVDAKKAQSASVEQTTDQPGSEAASKVDLTSLNEIEPNDSFESATPISCNNYISGSFDSNDDCDYYYFTTDEKISFALTLSHDFNDTYGDFCTFSIYSESDLENALYEDNSEIKEKETSSTKLRVNKGTYYIKLSPGYDYSEDLKNYKFIVTSANEDENFETEPNNEISEAKANNSIPLNTEITGNLQTSEDVDYYYFSLASAGKLDISFSHNKIDNSYTYWKVELISENETEPLISQDIIGSETVTKTDTISSSADSSNNYYLKVYSNYSHNDMDYKVKINFSAFPEPVSNDNGTYSYDREPNDTIEKATKIDLNKEIEGNIQSTEDVDYYQFEVNNDGELSIQFNHDFIDSDSNSWNVSVLSESSSENQLDFQVAQNEASFTSDTIRVSSGTYYLKIAPTYNYNNKSYSFKINFK